MITFLEHAVRIAGAMNRQGLWDEEDGFYYDNLRLPDGSSVPLRIHSMIGLLPILPAVTVPARRRSWARRWASGSRGSSRTPACPRPRCAPAARWSRRRAASR